MGPCVIEEEIELTFELALEAFELWYEKEVIAGVEWRLQVPQGKPYMLQYGLTHLRADSGGWRRLTIDEGREIDEECWGLNQKRLDAEDRVEEAGARANVPKAVIKNKIDQIEKDVDARHTE